MLGALLVAAATSACHRASTGPAPDGGPTPLPPIKAGSPQVWFAPLPVMPYRPDVPVGSLDFMDLFAPDAPWEAAAAHVAFFKLYESFIRGATAAELARVVAGLNARGIAIAVEAEPLLRTDACGDGVEGFGGGVPQGIDIAERIRRAGGVVRALAFDEPFYDAQAHCGWDTVRIASGIRDYVAGMRTVLPELIVGDIEPLLVDPATMEAWWDTYEAVAGTRLDFVQLDVDFARPSWPADALELEHHVRSRGIPFGLIAIGDRADASDASFAEHVDARLTEYEVVTGGHPDHVIFQSWVDKPDHCLPETSPTSFTHLIDRYFRPRTALSVAAGPAGLSGRLVDEAGAPVRGAALLLRSVATTGPGEVGTYTIRGTVPSGATEAVLIVRGNVECGCNGFSELRIYGATYAENAGANLLPDADLAAWPGPWGVASTGVVAAEPSDLGPGLLVHATTAHGETLAINAPGATVMPGASFDASFTARVAPQSTVGGYFGVAFTFAGGEVGRLTVPFASAEATTSAATDDGGHFRFDVGTPDPAARRFTVWYAGDDSRWPAAAFYPAR